MTSAAVHRNPVELFESSRGELTAADEIDRLDRTVSRYPVRLLRDFDEEKPCTSSMR